VDSQRATLKYPSESDINLASFKPSNIMVLIAATSLWVSIALIAITAYFFRPVRSELSLYQLMQRLI
jgi:hypothetical protein